MPSPDVLEIWSFHRICAMWILQRIMKSCEEDRDELKIDLLLASLVIANTVV